jgi:hypothetical protein
MSTIPRPFTRTVREFVFQIATIIAGILIALSVDSFMEARHERALVRDAHAAIGREIGENLEALNGSIPRLDEYERWLRVGLRFTEDMLQRGKTDVNELNFPLTMPRLNRASWQTAERTGALGYMDFTDVKAYAEIYDIQDLVLDGQRQQVSRIADVTARLYAGQDGDPTKMSRPELETFRGRLLDALGAISIHKMLSTQLVAGYKRAPKR